jgi:NAD(P)-dependent dehydrogenase (short-subunit alcohol dehydrogenase family)
MADMTGKTVVVTGANTGIGKETALALARAGARVVITSRDAAKGTAAVRDIRAGSGSETVEVLALDLADQRSIRAFADELLATTDRIDVLVNNAGILMGRRTETVDGFETMFGVNHLGSFALTGLLLDRIRASAPARIVNVSSRAHTQARRGLNFDDLQSERSFKTYDVYAKTKLANIYFTNVLAERLDGTGVTANALHPGFVASRFARDGDGGTLAAVAMVLGRPLAVSPAKGARTSVWAASAPELATTTGGYFFKCAPAVTSAAAQDTDAARRLWDVSEQLVGR